MQRYQRLSDRDLSALAIQGDGCALSAMLNRHIRLAGSVAAKHTIPGMDWDDIMSVCLIGLTKSIRAWNPTKAEFSTFAVTIMTNHVRHLHQPHLTKKRIHPNLVSSLDDMGQFRDPLLDRYASDTAVDPERFVISSLTCVIDQVWQEEHKSDGLTELTSILRMGATVTDAARTLRVPISTAKRAVKVFAQKHQHLIGESQ